MNIARDGGLVGVYSARRAILDRAVRCCWLILAPPFLRGHPGVAVGVDCLCPLPVTP